MKVSVISRGEVSQTLQIEVPTEAVAAEYERVYGRLAKNAALPGFRKGKVPRKILEPQLRGSVNQEVLESLLPQATFDAVKQESIQAVGRPKIDDLQYDGNGPISFKAVVEVKPEFSLGAVEGLPLKGPSGTVAESEVDEQVESLRQRQSSPGDPKQAAAAEGDWIKVDFQGFIAGQPFPGGHASDYPLVLGRKQLIPGFEEQLVGVQAGETRQLKVQFPADYPAKDVAGKAAEFMVTVKEVRLLKVPALDDAFAKTFGPEVADLAFLRDRLREALVEQKRRFRTQRLMDAAAEELLKRHSFPVPPSLIDAEAHALEQGELGRLAGQGMELNGEEGHAALHKALREPAEKRARLSLVLEKIAASTKLSATDEEFEAEMARLASQMKISAAEASRAIRQSGRENGVRAQILERKALEWVVEKAKVTDLA
jgi:trigger factor